MRVGCWTRVEVGSERRSRSGAERQSAHRLCGGGRGSAAAAVDAGATVGIAAAVEVSDGEPA